MPTQKPSTKILLGETAKALKTVRKADLRTAFNKQLALAEKTAKNGFKKKSSDYLQSLFAMAIMLSKVITAKVTSNILTGITIDAAKNNIIMPLVKYTKKSRCGSNLMCLSATSTVCSRIVGVGGCGTLPKEALDPW